MRIFKNYFSLILVAGLFAGIVSCEKEIIANYEVNEVDVLDGDLIKTRNKSDKQYTSILYTTLYKKAISVNKLVQTERVIQSFGDKSLIHEIIVSNYMNSGEVELPSDSFMRANPDQFIIDTYKKFYVRLPSEMEISFFRNYIEANPNVTTELVYTAFAASDEYQFY
ncbi:MAG: hypothetical protein H6606_00700 [Flavobacteriales bacterium]|nr:hypothetical protein [Flavobacteriales bacterium]